MVLVDEKTLYVHNGHDDDNEKLNDIWKYDLTSNQWTEINQKGAIPHGRNGHTLIKHQDYLIMFGGILEITKESEDLYAFHIPSSTWKLIDMS